MTTLLTDDPAVEPAGSGGKIEPAPDDGGGAPRQATDASAQVESAVSPALASAAAFLATAAAGWMVAGVFAGSLPRLVGVLGPAIGAGMVGISYRTRRPSVVQYLVVPVAVAAGALFVLPDATGGSANLPSLVEEAIRAGGLSQPPVPFDPGWRFLLLVVSAVLAAGTASLALSTNRPKLAILLAAPFLFGAALVQPADATALSAIVALVLVIGAMAVAFGADLAKEGATSGGFEARRFTRGIAVLGAMVGVLVVMTQLGLLLPETEEDQVVKPMRPQIPPPTPDRELFSVRTPVQLPWRLGVLDVYGLEENAWLTPPFRTSRLADIPDSGAVPFRGNDNGDSSTVRDAPRGLNGETIEVTFTFREIGGRVAPNIANPLRVRGGDGIEYDPRTQGFRLESGRARAGSSYTVTAPRPPDATQLIAAPPPGRALDEYLVAPEPPVEVDDMLATAPTANLFDRLQFVRTQYYANVIAAGSGEPVDVPASRVAEMLGGAEATPFEITAGEVLLARWAGVPARIGYGYYGGTVSPNGAAEPSNGGPLNIVVRPEHGAMWLEAYFEGHGWVPIVGTPPKAKASLSPDDKRDDPTVQATDKLALTVYVPIKLQSLQLLFEVVRYWAFRVAPVIAALVLLVLFYPGLLKLARRGRRRRWASRGGPAARIGVAYAELRDVANDFNIGVPTHTPLEFLADLTPDDEHGELAWLVTRGLWGDLRRDLRDEDANAAVEMAQSVTKRLRRANSGLPHVIAFASRASLREPYEPSIPNLWPQRSGRRRAVVPVVVAVASLVVAGLAVAVVRSTDRADLSSSVNPITDATLVPEQFGALRFVREAGVEGAFAEAGRSALVDSGQVFSLHEGRDIQASFQAAPFKRGLRGRERLVRDGLVRAIGAGRFTLTRLGDERVYVLDLPEQRLLLWFPPDGRYYELMVARRGFTQADDVFLSILAFQRGAGTALVDTSQRVERIDPRRGIRDGAAL